MVQAKQELRSRIRSVSSTRKITSAMEMIANAKLLKQRKMMENNREYARVLKSTVDEIAAKNKDIESEFMAAKKSTGTLTLIFCSDLGLCGSYNANIMKYAKENLKTEDPILVIGTALRRSLSEAGFRILNEPVQTDTITFLELKDYVRQGVHMYMQDQVSVFQILYMQFINTMTFSPKTETLLPCVMEGGSAEKEEGPQAETLFEPDPQTILSDLIPMMLDSVSYAAWLETKTAEQGNRRVAMKTATDNADDLNESLRLEYNKARQASITQEITEIIGGSSAV